MGTGGSTKGSASGSSLVPTWMDEPAAQPLPGSPDANPAQAPDRTGGDGDAPPAPPARPAIQPPPEAARFQSGRRNFSTFAASRGSDRGALRRAVGDYVRSGTRGSGNAVRRMGASRAAGSNVLGVLRGFQRDGVPETLRRLNLAGLVGGSAQDVFIGLTDVICRDGGSIDEALARDAWLETIAELERIGIGDLNTLSGDQIGEVFLTFIAHAIETRLFQEIGVNSLQVAPDLASIERFEAQFKSYIERAVRDSFGSDLTQLSAMSDARIKAVVDQTYLQAWELLELWGDAEE